MKKKKTSQFLFQLPLYFLMPKKKKQTNKDNRIITERLRYLTDWSARNQKKNIQQFSLNLFSIKHILREYDAQKKNINSRKSELLLYFYCYHILKIVKNYQEPSNLVKFVTTSIRQSSTNWSQLIVISFIFTIYCLP